jgi:magnesium chelatase subunit D
MLALSLALGAPGTFGGVLVRGFRADALLAAAGEARRLPVAVDRERLLGGLDLAATLAAGAPRMATGIFAGTAGVLVIPSAERVGADVAAAVAAMLDGTAVDAADGPVAPRPVIAFDEGIGDDPPVDARLADRLAFVLGEADPVSAPALLPAGWWAVALPETLGEELVAAALALGVPGLRASLHAAAAAKAIAALAGRGAVTEADAAEAVALVLAPRATRLPVPPEAEASPPADAPEPQEGEGGDAPAGDRLVEAARALLPAGLLAALAAAPRRSAEGRAGGRVKGGRGRPAGVRAGLPGRDGRLALVETLTAAAPWRTLRGGTARIPVRRADLRVRRIKAKAATATVFCVDASGSQAFARMAEAKGAVEHLLAEAYVRRDHVALVAFRKDGAEVLLPPTPSLTRAKRALAGLPGGGGTPLAAGLGAALRIAVRAAREGRQPTVVVMTDGRANVTLAGTGGRAEAMAEAAAAARAIRAAGLAAVVIDTANRPGEAAAHLAREMGARYAPLPRANPAGLVALSRL